MSPWQGNRLNSRQSGHQCRFPLCAICRVRLGHATRAAQQVSRSQPVTCRTTEARAGGILEICGHDTNTRTNSKAGMCMHVTCASIASNKPASSCKLCVSKSRDRQCRRPCFIGPAFFYRPRLTSPGYGGFRGPHGRPHASGEHHEHSGRPQPALQHVLPIFEWVAEAGKKGLHHQHQRGSVQGVRGRAPGFYLHTFTCKL